MKAVFIEPLNSIIIGDKALTGERVEDGIFGGFCNCGGVMYQRARFKNGNTGIVLSECEKCWKNQAIVISLDEGKVEKKLEVEVVNRGKVQEFLKSLLSESEYESLKSKMMGKEYSYASFSKAKKKLEKLGIDVNELASLF